MQVICQQKTTEMSICQDFQDCLDARCGGGRLAQGSYFRRSLNIHRLLKI